MNFLSRRRRVPVRGASARGVVSGNRRLTRLYVLALTAIALLSIGAQFWVHRALARQESDARVINIAGRQRMLSQRIAKNALILALDARAPDQISARAQLVDDLKIWRGVNDALQKGDEKLRLPGANSPDIAARFAAIDPRFEVIARGAQNVLDGQIGPRAVAPILENERPWLKGMDAIVFAFDAQATARVTRLKRAELILLALTLGVLGAEALWIFRPTARQIQSAMQDLARAQSQQKAMLEALPDAVLLFDAEGRLLEAYPPAARELVGPGEINFARHLKAARAVGAAKSWEFAGRRRRHARSAFGAH